MARKVNLPGADELFRPTESAALDVAAPAPAPAARTTARSRGAASGRVRHDEKITVYVSSEELLELEQLRLRLRAEFGLSVDRGRIVREALALAMSDVAEHAQDSALVARLSGQ